MRKFKPGDRVAVLQSGADGAYVEVGDVGIIVDMDEYPVQRRFVDLNNNYAVRFNKAVCGYFDKNTAVIAGVFLKRSWTEEEMYEDESF